MNAIRYEICQIRTSKGGYCLDFSNTTIVISIRSQIVDVVLSNEECFCITDTVEHNYISPSSIVGIQLHVSALYMGHLQVVI